MDSPVTRQEFLMETEKIFDKLNKNDRRITVVETVIENFKGLPAALNSLEKTMALMGQNLESLNKKVDTILESADSKDEYDKEKDKERDERIKALDDKSKVDILEALKKNWWGIVLVVAAIFIIIKDMIPI